MWGRIDTGAIRLPRLEPEAARRGGARAARLCVLAGRELGRILWRRRLLVLACPAVVLGLTAAYVATLPSLFEAATLVAVDQGAAGPGMLSVETAAGVSSEQPSLADEASLIRSRAMAERLVDRLDLQLSAEFNRRPAPGSTWGSAGRSALGLITAALLDASPESEPTDAERAARLRDRIVDAVLPRIQAEPADRSALSLRFVAADPRLAAAGATGLAELYLEHRREFSQQERQRERQRLGEEVERLAAALGATEDAIAALRANAPAGRDGASERSLLDLNGELDYWRGERLVLEARLGRAAGPRVADASLDGAEQFPDAALLREPSAREVELKEDLAALSQDPQVSGLRDELGALDDGKRAEIELGVAALEREIAIIRSRESALEAEIEAQRKRVAMGPVASDLETLERQAEADRQLLLTYVARVEQLDAAPPVREVDARVVPAAVPTEPKYPRLGLIYGTALGAALLLGGLLALGAEAWARARP